ncbi:MULTISPECIES: type II secretion system protein [Psychrilyobacter]|uniref:Prepilin-type N-terminal cleavage/methylation domain-containing protein n=1 Tax=Psychrilyobacter piezotolerans TaxID=2293438 RepID=A0ABX9KGR2_9FUSO|nr:MULTISPECIES: type II secretion system protein [Psychrilyobacter]MCS5420451.1 type II secretion system GspH family protein [Psychrilyobacter sp. S5]NDI78230.1 type II secretion system protein [Psychrilyobacter piezotolerans]RDE61210.1 type II secretion system protein [Psychrilyobacter sp. S5]REI40878.1 prepilin-type N-terminal cleavage/methylation domain-containing protein [Psychrilyobacter piezotolerans]
MKKNFKKGFTIIELLVVISMIGVLTGTVAPKLLKEMRKATVAKVQHNLGVIRSRLSLDETFLEEFPNLYDKTNTDLLKAYIIESTPSFTDGKGEGHEATSKVTYSRTNDGGWIYNREKGEIYANLPDGAYTKDEGYEIWGGETPAISEITYNGSDDLSYGKLQFKNEDGHWEDMVDGEVYSSDTEIQYVPYKGNVSGNANQINIGTNTGETVSLSDWGKISGNTAVLESDGTTITTTVSSGNLEAFNGPNSHLGAGIGTSNGSSGLSSGDTLRIDIDGEDINKVIFTLDGLGGYFDATSSHATQVEISAFDENGVLIETQSSYRDSGSFSDQYSFEITQPVSYFELGTTGSNGTYVVQSVNLIKSAQDQVNLTIQHPDGTTEEISRDILLDDTNSGDPITINEKLEEDV